MESFSEDEDGDRTVDKEGKVEPTSSVSNIELDPSTAVAPAEIQTLLHRKEELERRHRKQERHRQRVQVGCFFIEIALLWSLHFRLNLNETYQNIMCFL